MWNAETNIGQLASAVEEEMADYAGPCVRQGHVVSDNAKSRADEK